MIAIIVREGAGPPVRFEFDQAEITYGNAAENHLVLEQYAARRHGRLVAKDGRLIVVDLKSASGTFVNNRLITSPVVIRPSDQVKVGRSVFHAGLVSAWPDDGDITPIVHATEIRLLAEIGAGDDVARSVYADWLEEHGQPTRAEILRLIQAHEAAPAFARDEIWNRIRDLALSIEPRWLLRVARPKLACREEQCPGWIGLGRTARAHLRSCGRCARSVVYCVRSLDLQTEPQLGNQVAVDLAVENPDRRD